MSAVRCCSSSPHLRTEILLLPIRVSRINRFFFAGNWCAKSWWYNWIRLIFGTTVTNRFSIEPNPSVWTGSVRFRAFVVFVSNRTYTTQCDSKQLNLYPFNSEPSTIWWAVVIFTHPRTILRAGFCGCVSLFIDMRRLCPIAEWNGFTSSASVEMNWLSYIFYAFFSSIFGWASVYSTNFGKTKMIPSHASCNRRQS